MTTASRYFKIGPARLFVHFCVLVIVVIWLVPTLGIFVSALRDRDQITVSGWWTAFAGSTQTVAVRLGTPDQQKQEGDVYVITGNVLADQPGRSVKAFGVRVQQPSAFGAGETADLGDGESLVINSDGSYRYMKNAAFAPDERPRRIYVAASAPPEFTMQNYQTVLASEGIGQSFINSLTVTIPATIIPILIAAFAAYALSWMEFPARVDGASDFEIFTRIVLPLSFPALASFAIFQFLWVWNDLLVAMVFLGTDKDHLVLTGALNALLGSRGGNWEILTASAFVTIIVPLLVFFGLQRYLVRGLLAGSVKGG
jgi:ABC-type glycerol-3-phosphate transport system permease component